MAQKASVGLVEVLGASAMAWCGLDTGHVHRRVPAPGTTGDGAGGAATLLYCISVTSIIHLKETEHCNL